MGDGCEGDRGWAGWMKVALANRGMTVEAATMHKRKERVESPGTYVIE